jgi:DUF1365 family protein
MILYTARLTHVRHRIVVRRFTHRVRLRQVDLDHLPKSNILVFRAADHLGSPNRSIRANLTAWLDSFGIPAPARVLMPAAPRSFGYAFNPLTATGRAARADDHAAPGRRARVHGDTRRPPSRPFWIQK